MENVKPLNPNERIIHIKAESSIYSVYELVPESKAVSVLENIRDNFRKQNIRKGSISSLKVSTCVHNPTLW